MDKNLFEAHPASFDLTRPGSAVGFFTPIDCPNRISEASLVMFQNCLSEFPQSDYDVVIRNTLDLLRMMKAGKIMLVIDRAGYQHVMNLISRISSLAVTHSLAKVIVFDQRRTLDCNPILEKMPSILAANLLVWKTRLGESTPDSDKLICARQVRYDCLALQRV